MWLGSAVPIRVSEVSSTTLERVRPSSVGKWVQADHLWTGRWGFDPIDAAEEANRIVIMEQVVRVLFPGDKALPAARPDVRSLRDHIQ